MYLGRSRIIARNHVRDIINTTERRTQLNLNFTPRRTWTHSSSWLGKFRCPSRASLSHTLSIIRLVSLRGPLDIHKLTALPEKSRGSNISTAKKHASLAPRKLSQLSFSTQYSTMAESNQPLRYVDVRTQSSPL